MKEPIWLTSAEVLEMHRRQIAKFGGADGVRDHGLLESALARPQNKFHFENIDDPFALATAYGFGIARNHPFTDGNKRTAFAAMAVFLQINGETFNRSNDSVIETVLALAAGKLTKEQLDNWLKQNCE